jgi:hypothetical protein
MNYNETNLPASVGDDGFEVTANETSGAIVGRLLKFVKGKYYVGKGKEEELPLDTELVAVATSLSWQKWGKDGDGNSRVLDERKRVGSKRLPAREQLGDLDEDLWERDKYDESIDPWKLTRFLYLVNPKTAEDYTFSTTSWGGHDAIRALSRQIAIKRTHASGANAIVKLSVGYKQSKEYGSIPAPKFMVTGWTGETGEPKAIAPPIDDGFADELPKRREMDDEIPF